MQKFFFKSKNLIACFIFALVLCLGVGAVSLEFAHTSKLKTIPSLSYTMPEEFTGNYIVSGNNVYAEIDEDSNVTEGTLTTATQSNSPQSAHSAASPLTMGHKKYVILSGANDSLRSRDDNLVNLTNATLGSFAYSHGGLNTFGFSKDGTLNITFIKDDMSSNFCNNNLSFKDNYNLLNTEIVGSRLGELTAQQYDGFVASTLTATYNKGTVEMTVMGEDGQVNIETSEDASYTLGELVTNTNQILNVDNCVFSISDNTFGDSLNSGSMLMSATLADSAAPYGRANTLVSEDLSEKQGQILKLTQGSLKLGSTSTQKIYQPKLTNGSYKKGCAIYQLGGTLSINNCKFINFITSQNGSVINSSGITNISNCNFESNTSSLGGAIYVEASTSKLEISGETNIKNNTAVFGGAIYISGTLIIKDNVQLIGNIASECGGAIQSYGNVIIESATISNNQANSGAGAYFNDGTIVMNGGTFAGNIATGSGGAIFVDSNTKSTIFTMNDGIIGESSIINTSETNFSNKAAYHGGAICVESNSSTVYSTINLNGGIICGNACFGNYTYTSGGGISSLSSQDKINIGGTSIEHNASGYEGGGLRLTGTAVMTAGSIISNSSQYGAGILTREDSSFTMSGGNIGSNISSGHGGAIYAKGIVTISEASKIYGNTTSGKGGAIYITGSTLTVTGGTIGDATKTTVATSSQFSNKSGNHGGAIYSENSATINLHGGTIAYNVSMQAGGAVYSEDATDKISIKDPFVAKYNKSAYSGGAIYSFGIVTMTGGTLDHNSANSWGGGIIVKTPGNIFTGGTISNNQSQNGAGGLCIDAATTLDGVNIHNNQTPQNGGGIAYNEGTSVYLKSGNIYNNQASKLGGGIYCGSGILNISDTAVIRDNAAGCGGGIYSKSNLNITGGQIYNNKAQDGSGLDYTNMGGGIFIQGSTLTITDGIIGTADISSAATESNKSNWCSNAGGGIACGGGATLNLNGGRISANWAPGGGGIYSNDSTDKVNIAGVTISYNSSYDWSGGGLYSHGVVTMTSGTVSNNSSATFGGGIMLKARENIISGGEIGYNQAVGGEGGGIRIDGTATISGTVTIHHNKAVEGGGISVATGATISGGTISGNSATNTGGGIRNHSSLTITGGSITGNNAVTGGAIYNAGTTRISGGNITANGDATKCTIGGIYSNRTLEISGGSITNNQSSWATQNIRIVDGTFTISGNATISTNRANVTNIYIEKGIFNLNSNFTSNNGSNSGAIGLNENLYINVNTTLTKTYTIQKSTLTSFDDGDTASSYIAYSSNNTYLSSAKTYLSVITLPAGRTTSITRKTNYLVMEHSRYALDLNPKLNGEVVGNGITGIKFGIKINGVDQGYVQDFYNSEILYGSTWEIYGAQYDQNKFIITSSIPASGTVTGYTALSPEVIKLYTITFKVVNSNYGTIGGSYLGGFNLSTATFKVRHDDFATISVEGNVLGLIYPDLVTATPKTGYKFTGWSGNISGVIAEDRVVTANFAPIYYDVTVKVSNSNYGYLSSNSQLLDNETQFIFKIPHGYTTDVTGSTIDFDRGFEDVTAHAKTGYRFTGWSTVPSTITGSVTITANFEQLIKVTFRLDKSVANSYKIYFKEPGGSKQYLYNLLNSSGVYEVYLPKEFYIGAESLYYSEGSSGETYDTLKAGTSNGSSAFGSVRPSESSDGYYDKNFVMRSNANVTIYISVQRTYG